MALSAPSSTIFLRAFEVLIISTLMRRIRRVPGRMFTTDKHGNIDFTGGDDFEVDPGICQIRPSVQHSFGGADFPGYSVGLRPT